MLVLNINTSYADDAAIENIIKNAQNTPLEASAKSDLANKIQNEIDMSVDNNVKTEPIKKGNGEGMSQELKNESLTGSESVSGDTILIKTSKGPIKIKLFTKEAPKTSQHILELVNKGFYNGTVFHRVVDGFVIQGGDPLGNGTGNYIDKETGKTKYIDLEINPNLKWDKIGRVGMARTSSPNSASCQFFIALDAVPFLNPGGVDKNGYAVFGQVTDDTIETLKKIVKDNKPVSPGSETPSNPVKMDSVEIVK